MRPPSRVPVARSLRRPPLEEEVVRVELPPGLVVMVLPKPGFAQTSVQLATAFGGADHEFLPASGGAPVVLPAGCAHFLEHQLFEYEEGPNAADRLAEQGAESNAFTDYDLTAYLFSTSHRERLGAAFEILFDFVWHPRFTPASVRAEREIIEQELMMYRDSPAWRLHHNLLAALYHRHPVRVDIAGTPESVKDITAEHLHTCHRMFYHPGQMALAVAGDVDPGAVLDTCAAVLARRDWGPAPAPVRPRPAEPAAVREARAVDRMPVARPQVLIGYKDADTGVRGMAWLRQALATDLVLEWLFGAGSDLFASLYDEGLVDRGFNAYYHGERGYGHSVVGGETPDPERLVHRVLDHVERATRSGIPDEDLARLTRVLWGETIDAFDDPDEGASLLVYRHFRGLDPFAALEACGTLDAEYVNGRLRRHFDRERVAISVVTPA